MKATRPKKSVASEPQAAAPKTDQIAEWVDELGAIEKELAPLAGKIARADVLRKALRGQTEGHAADKPLELAGKRFIACFGVRGFATRVDWPELVRRITPAKFAVFAKATLADLNKNVAAGHLAHVLSQEQTGPRSLRIVEKGGA